jgi:hypothetical protein
MAMDSTITTFEFGRAGHAARPNQKNEPSEIDPLWSIKPLISKALREIETISDIVNFPERASAESAHPDRNPAAARRGLEPRHAARTNRKNEPTRKPTKFAPK